MTGELKPCPFCGEVPDEMHRASTKCSSTMPHAGQYHGEVWHYCGNGMQVSASTYRAGKADALRAAIDIWNTRAERTTDVRKGEGDTQGWWVCGECGCAFDMIGAMACNNRKKPSYCPGCGRQVVDR